LAGLLRLRGLAGVNRRIEVKSEALAKPRARQPEFNSRISGSGQTEKDWHHSGTAGQPLRAELLTDSRRSTSEPSADILPNIT
jgi:hypothetical protein